jgi:hypothetical protein
MSLGGFQNPEGPHEAVNQAFWIFSEKDKKMDKTKSGVPLRMQRV